MLADVDDRPVCLDPLRRDGLQIVRGFFSGEARSRMEARGREVVEGVASGRIQRSGQFATGLETRWFEEVFADPRLLDLVAEALGPNLCIATWRVLMKDRHFDGPINVHQDWPYFGGDTRKLNVFIPMTSMNAENGGLVFYEKSHMFEPLERGDIDVRRFEPDLEKTCPDLEVGDVLLADFLTWHYSAPAQVARERILFQLVFQPADDPSSAHLLRGERRNPFVCPDRYAPLSEPLSQLNVGVGRSYLASGDLDRAERFARGMLASDTNHVGAAILLSDVLRARGCADAADAKLEEARAALSSLERALAERGRANGNGVERQQPSAAPQPDARVASLEHDLAVLKASRSWRWTAPFRRRR